MSQIVLKLERKRYRFYVIDDAGKTLFKGTMCMKKDDAVRRANVMLQAGDELADHLQIVDGGVQHSSEFAVRGEDHRSREGEKGRIGDAVPLGFSDMFKSREEAEAAKAAIIEAVHGAQGLVDETE